MNNMTSDALKQTLAETLSPNAEVRRAAEERLSQAQKDPSHHLEVLKLVASSDSATADGEALRQAAAVHFKNSIKKGWDIHREEGNSGIVFTEPDRLTIKSHLVQLMCTVPPRIQALLSESISLIAENDYPDQWTNLLPELVHQFQSTELTTVIGVLKTANSIFKRFRHVERSDSLYRVILYTLEHIQGPLLALFRNVGQAIPSCANDLAALTPRLEILRLICQIYYSLIYQDLPAFFEDHMSEWMTDFAMYLQYQNPLLVDDTEEQTPSPIDQLQASIMEILLLFVTNDEESFQEYLSQFTSLVWNNLVQHVTPFPKHDALATKSIKFLSTLVQKLMYKNLFEENSTLRQIIGKIVIPNLTFREVDEERFEDDPREYILTEVEGSDSESRRRCSQDLLRAMCRLFETETVVIGGEHISSMLAEYAANPTTAWVAKDAAIHLMMGIAINKESSLGVSEITAGVNILDFFQRQILPELRDSNHTSRPVLKATALKFVSVFRKQFTRDDLVQLFPLLIQHLASPVVVVHTFAAYTIERLLFTKDEVVGGPSVYKIPSTDIRPFVEPLFTALFAIVDNLEHNENDYVMKCVMRALIRVGEDILPVTQIVLAKLTAALGRVAANPRNPQFNHFLFESIAVLVRSVCSKNPTGGSTLEAMLFEPFTVILQVDIAEFTPYVFQVLAQLLEYRPPGTGLSPAYQGLFSPLLSPTLWEKRGNVPALARLVQAYICKAAPELVPHLNPILGVFQKLISVKATEVSSFEILNSVILHFPAETLEPALPTIFSILFTRLMASNTPRYTQLVTTFFALFIGKYGLQVFLDRTNVIQPGVGVMVILQVLAPRLKNNPPAHRTEAKIHVVGVTRLLCEPAGLLNDVDGPKAWVESLAGVVTLLISSNYQNVVTKIAGDEPEFETGYDAQFSRLVQAAKVAEDFFPEVVDPSAHFVQSLHNALKANSRQLVPLIQQGLNDQPKPIKDGLDFMFQQAGFSLG